MDCRAGLAVTKVFDGLSISLVVELNATLFGQLGPAGDVRADVLTELFGRYGGRFDRFDRQLLTHVGSTTPYHCCASKPLKPDSSSVGTSFDSGWRCRSVTAIGRTRPERICGMAAAKPGNMACVWPPIKSLKAGAMPRYGMCTMKESTSCLNSSIVMCVSEPAPAEP
jgi:hypothetical protein